MMALPLNAIAPNKANATPPAIDGVTEAVAWDGEPGEDERDVRCTLGGTRNVTEFAKGAHCHLLPGQGLRFVIYQ